tara:strand:+ start:810 stop:1340 length:531 start_codon:yes stop_codon:yes gene_type:complete
MNWFDILKEQASVQSSRAGMAPIDIQKPFKRVKEDESDCYDKFVKIYEKTKNSFPNAKYVKHDQVGDEQQFIYHYNEFRMYFTSIIPKKGKIPDKVFCDAIKTYKEITASRFKKDSIENYAVYITKEEDIHYIDILNNTKETLEASIIIDADHPYSGKGIIPDINGNIDGWRGSFI